MYISIMLRINETLDESYRERKRLVHKTWIEILKKGIEVFEEEKGHEKGEQEFDIDSYLDSGVSAV